MPQYSIVRTGTVGDYVTNGDDEIPLGVSPNTKYYGSNGTGSFYSFHPGGINVAFADGAVSSSARRSTFASSRS